MSAVERAETYPLPAARKRTALSPLRGVAFVYKWELLKLRAQKRTYLGLGAAAIVPLAFVLALIFRSGGPGDITLGKYLRESGLATPFVVLEFMSIWGLPLITALVAGDIVASESHNGTLKTILTRSRERGEVFAGKALATATYTTRCAVVADGRDRPGRCDRRVGLQAAHLALRPEGLGARTASCCCSAPSASTCSLCSGSPPSGS